MSTPNIEYTVINASEGPGGDTSKFVEAVNKALSEGWTPQGGVVSCYVLRNLDPPMPDGHPASGYQLVRGHIEYTQAMVREISS